MQKVLLLLLDQKDTFYAMVKPEDCEEIIQTHIIDGNRVERLLAKDIDGTKVNSLDDFKIFYKKQKRIALKIVVLLTQKRLMNI